MLGRRCVELLGEGDVMRPWQWDPDPGAHVHAEVGWVVLEPSRLAVLDHGLVQRMNPWPQLGVELFARGLGGPPTLWRWRWPSPIISGWRIGCASRSASRRPVGPGSRPRAPRLPLPLSHERLAHISSARSGRR